MQQLAVQQRWTELRHAFGDCFRSHLTTCGRSTQDPEQGGATRREKPGADRVARLWIYARAEAGTRGAACMAAHHSGNATQHREQVTAQVVMADHLLRVRKRP